MEEKLIHTLSGISKVLKSSFEPEETFDLILDELKNILNYDKVAIMFIDGDGLTLKASRNVSEIFDKSKNKSLKNNALLNRLTKSQTSILESITDPTKSLITGLNLCIKAPYSYLIAPMMIRDSLFGIILLIKEQENYYSNDDIPVIETFTNAASYAVKDAELSNVFKIQLKILKENIVERSEAFKVIKEQNQKILEADKLKNEFLANISHELRTPLNAIIGFSEALKLKIFGNLNEKQEEYIDDIHTSGVHLLAMINDLLDISKIEANAMKLYKSEFAVYPIIEEVISIIHALADKKNIELKILCKNKDINIYADTQKFQQIMYNLLSNAVKFTNENGKIEIGVNKDDNNIKIYVKDNGIGIDPKYHGKIFAKFQQVDSSYTRKQGSTGLGLTITKELIGMHNGKIWLESKVNEGTTFTFTIPIGENEGSNTT